MYFFHRVSSTTKKSSISSNWVTHLSGRSGHRNGRFALVCVSVCKCVCVCLCACVCVCVCVCVMEAAFSDDIWLWYWNSSSSVFGLQGELHSIISISSHYLIHSQHKCWLMLVNAIQIIAPIGLRTRRPSVESKLTVELNRIELSSAAHLADLDEKKKKNFVEKIAPVTFLPFIYSIDIIYLSRLRWFTWKYEALLWLRHQRHRRANICRHREFRLIFGRFPPIEKMNFDEEIASYVLMSLSSEMDESVSIKMRLWLSTDALLWLLTRTLSVGEFHRTCDIFYGLFDNYEKWTLLRKLRTTW